MDGPQSRAELAELLQAHGISPALADLAKWGLELVPDEEAESHLGGRPLLAGEWPLSTDGRAHTHLVSIVLEELPDFEDRDLLPARGTLVCFAHIGDAGDDEAHVVHVAPDEGRAVTPPDEPPESRAVPAELNEQRVRFEPRLTVPFPRELEYEEAMALSEVGDLTMPEHLLLGHPVYVQDNPPEDDRISLLQINWDESLGFTFGDGGQVTLHGTPDDIRAGRWETITAQTDGS